MGNRMKSDYSVSLSKDAGSSNHSTADSVESVATTIARLTEENKTLRRLAALLTSQLKRARGARGLAENEG
jgi:hypothetical protein